MSWTLFIYLCELALWAIICWYIISFIGMPTNPARVCQFLIVAIAIFASLQAIIPLGSPPPAQRPLSSISPPSIMR